LTPLIDGDILRYEIGSIGQITNKGGEIDIRSFDFISEQLESRVDDICKYAGGTEPPIIYITGSREDVRDGIFIPNFREAIAITKPYKGTRINDKPFHYPNLTVYLRYRYDTRTAFGMEADDLISIEQFSRLDRNDTIICTRDKDLRQCPGWHYGWECGKQPEFGPVEYDEFGTISLERGKIRGGGLKFFFSQLLTGDAVDNIGGLRGYGPTKTYALLSGCKTEEECRSVIYSSYQALHPDNWLTLLQEQSDLLWIVKELNKDGSFKHYEW
jgi:hypothetical protein